MSLRQSMSCTNVRFTENITHRFTEAQGADTFGMAKRIAERDRSPFGQRMYEARIAKGLTIEQAAKAVGVSIGTLSQAERTGGGTALLIQFADLYGVSPRWLALGQGAMFTGAMPALSEDVLDLAVQIDEIVNHDPDERRRKWAFAMMNLAVTPPPKSPGQTAELMLRLLQESPTT